MVDAVVAGDNVVVQARAGTGKTTTLLLATRAVPRTRVLYLAYNAETAQSARRRFGRNVHCSTLHAFARTAAPHWVTDRMGRSRQAAADVAAILGITQPVRIRKDTLGMPVEVHLTPRHLARLAMGAVRQFCYSSDTEIGWWHIPPQTGLTDTANHHLARFLVPYANRAWDDIVHPRGLLRFEHDFYLKAWALTEPALPYELVMLDEAQDSNDLTVHLIASQDLTQTVLVGDPDQQLYAWRGAVSAMQSFPDHRLLSLTRSHRFGPAVAEMGNVFLRLRGSRPLVAGTPELDSRVVEHIAEPDAILCRTNAGAMEQVIAQLDTGRPVYLKGGGDVVRGLAEAALELEHGSGTNHPELAAFRSWREVVEYVEHDPAGSDLRAFVRLVQEHGAQAILDACDRLANPVTAPGTRTTPPPPRGAVVVSTLHRCKGLEFDTVRIAADVPAPTHPVRPPDPHVDPAEMMLDYVGATRARLLLEPGPLRYWRDAEAAAHRPALTTATKG